MPRMPVDVKMDKREFLKTSGVLFSSALLSRYIAAEEASAIRTNWAGNYTYRTDHLLTPANVPEVQTAVRECSNIKALGTRHSFNGIADSSHNQISLEHLQTMTLNPAARTVTVGAGVTYGQLGPYLDAHGYALHNLASLPQISVVGACATATHGSGIKNGNLSTAVAAMEIVTANGDVVVLSRAHDPEKFPGAVVGLGAFGIVTHLTLNVEPTYQVSQVVYENLPMAVLKHHLEEIFASGYSVSLFTDWQNDRISQAWIKSRVEPGAAPKPTPEFFGAKLATRKLHPLPGHSAESCTEQMGIPGPWYDRLPHFRMGFVPSSGAELQTEYFVARENGYAAIRAVQELHEQISPHLLITELRTIAADDLWMSPCYQQPSMTVHFTWKPEWPEVKKVLPLIEAKLAPFQARPHWAKLFTVPPTQLKPMYAKMSDYKELAESYDPKGKFRNQFLNTNIWTA